jgi:hypothetical protein
VWIAKLKTETVNHAGILQLLPWTCYRLLAPVDKRWNAGFAVALTGDCSMARACQAGIDAIAMMV